MAFASTSYFPAVGITETSGPTALSPGSISDGYVLLRDGTSIIGHGGIRKVAADPRTAGLSADIGTIAFDGTNSFTYQKVGAANTDWRRMDIQKSTAGSDVTSVSFTIDGDKAGGVMIEGYVIPPSGSNGVFSLQPNSVSTNQVSTLCVGLGSGSASGGNTTDLRLGNSDTNEICTFRAIFRTRTGRIRSLESIYDRALAGTAPTVEGVVKGHWNETATNITTLVIVSSVASAIGTGSRITLTELGNPLL